MSPRHTSATLAFQQTAESRHTLRCKRSHQQNLHRRDNNLKPLPLLCRHTAHVILKTIAADVAGFAKPPHPRQATYGSNGLTLVTCSDVVFPIAFLRACGLRSRELREDVPRHIEVLNHLRGGGSGISLCTKGAVTRNSISSTRDLSSYVKD